MGNSFQNIQSDLNNELNKIVTQLESINQRINSFSTDSIIELELRNRTITYLQQLLSDIKTFRNFLDETGTAEDYQKLKELLEKWN